MRLLFWLIGLFAVAAAVALFAGNNHGVVSVFWPPYRVDVSVNLALLVLAAVFVLLYLAVRAVSLFVSLPTQARLWRQRRQEAAVHGVFLEALTLFQSGRFSRARKLAEQAISLHHDLAKSQERANHGAALLMMSHLMAAECLHALRDRGARDAHLKAVLALRQPRVDPIAQAALEATQIRAARWALDDRDSTLALARLDELPVGMGRRILVLRIRLKAARLAGQARMALETTRALIRHKAFSAAAAVSMVRGLAIESIDSARDADQLKRLWDTLDPAERAGPELAIRLAKRLCELDGDAALARSWLMPAWQEMVNAPAEFDRQLRSTLITVLEDSNHSADTDWLGRVESAHQAFPMDPELAYLAGVTCMKHQLWGKAQQLLARAASQLPDSELRRRAWLALADLALQRGEPEVAAQAWRQAASAPPASLS